MGGGRVGRASRGRSAHVTSRCFVGRFGPYVGRAAALLIGAAVAGQVGLGRLLRLRKAVNGTGLRYT